MFHRHIHDDNRRRLGDPSPVDPVRYRAAGIVTGQKGHRLIDIAMGSGNTRIGEAANSGSHSGNDAKRNAMLYQGQRLFCSPPKYERITAFQAQHLLSRFCKFNKPQGYITLFWRRLAAALACIFQSGIRILERQAGIIHQRVVNDDICLL